MLHTPLYHQHTALQSKLIPFGEWEMPLHYGSQLEEHHAVRQRAGLFDVSHMMITDLSGKDSYLFLRYLLANDVAKLHPGQALYTCILNENGGILDDAILIFLNNDHYRLISNATTRTKIKNWLITQQKNIKQHTISLHFRDDLAILALQGPHTFSALHQLGLTQYNSDNLRNFYSAPFQSGLIARTGYTGEMGVEIMLPPDEANNLWEKLIALGVQPCGLGARDTLRLEMGYNLYGSDMDESTTPLESNLKWTVSLSPDRDFIGKKALEKQLATGITRQLIGLTLTTKAIPRAHYPIFSNEKQIGEITSGTFSPTLNQGIALARLPYPASACQLKIRDTFHDITLTKPPFIKPGV